MFFELPVIAWVLGALGITTVVGAATGFLVPLVTAIFLMIMGAIFLQRGVEALIVGSSSIGGFLVLISLGAFAFSLNLINPNFLSTPVGLTAAGTLNVPLTKSTMSSSALLSVVPISSTFIGSSGTISLLFYGIVLYGLYSLYEMKGKRRL